MKMWHPDEGTIHSWIDGALPAAEARRVEGHIEECESCRGMVAEARGLVAGASRIVGALDDVPGGVIPASPPVVGGYGARSGGSPLRSAGGIRRSFWQGPGLRIAAGLVFVAGVSALVVREGGWQRSPAAPLPLFSDSAGSQPGGASASAPGSGVVPAAPGAFFKGPDMTAGAVDAAAEKVSSGTAPPGQARGAGVGGGGGGARSLDSASRQLAQGQRGEAKQEAVSALVPPQLNARVIATREADSVGPPSVLGLAAPSNVRDLIPETRLERLPPVLGTPTLDVDHFARLERESSGCYLLSVVAADTNSRRMALADSLEGIVQLDSGVSAPTLALADAAQRQRAGGVAANADSGQGRVGGAGRGGRGGAGRGGRRGGGGGGRGGGRGATTSSGVGADSTVPVPLSPTMSVRALGWRVIAGDSLELRIAVDTAQIAVKFRLGDSTMTGVVSAVGDSALGVVGNVTAQRSPCE